MDFRKNDSTYEEGEPVLKDFNKIFADMEGDIYRKEYVKTSNPLYVFEAYRSYRAGGVPPPDWILNYFDKVSGFLLGEAANRTDGNYSNRRAPVHVYSILGMSRDVFNDYASRKVHVSAAIFFAMMKEKKPNASNASIFRKIVEKFNVSIKTVETWYAKTDKFKELI